MPDLDLVRILEGALFASREPLSIQAMKKLFAHLKVPTEGMLREALERLAFQYQDRMITLVEVSGGWRFQVNDLIAPYLANLQQERPTRYSRATLETLAMIAYRQPLTRGDIEAIRGVSVSSQIIRTLTERNWIIVIGHKEVPGRPALFATTTQVLNDFGLLSLEDLPGIDESMSTFSEDSSLSREAGDE